MLNTPLPDRTSYFTIKGAFESVYATQGDRIIAGLGATTLFLELKASHHPFSTINDLVRPVADEIAPGKWEWRASFLQALRDRAHIEQMRGEGQPHEQIVSYLCNAGYSPMEIAAFIEGLYNIASGAARRFVDRVLQREKGN